MRRKLVPFDGAQFGEVDPIALSRTAHQLLELASTVPEGDSYGIHTHLIPVLNKAIQGKISKPFRDESDFVGGRYIYEGREGMLSATFSRQFQSAYAKFVVAVMSLPLGPSEVEWVDGQKCAWMDFEEEGDWPTKVKYP